MPKYPNHDKYEVSNTRRCRDGVNCMHADSSLLVCGLLDKSIVVYDRATLERIYELNGHTDHVWSIDLCDRCDIISCLWLFINSVMISSSDYIV